MLVSKGRLIIHLVLCEPIYDALIKFAKFEGLLGGEDGLCLLAWCGKLRLTL